MPKVLGLLGRAAPRLGTRRISFILIGISLFAVLSLVFTLPGALPDGPSLSRYTDHKSSLPLPSLKNPFTHDKFVNPFRPPSHPPPRQKNDTFEESSWWANWKWLTPFSSSLTLDEDRSVLPHIPDRPPVYCYYDVTTKKDAETKDAESELLLTWRMAWWSKGFKPIILSAAEAMNNPHYDTLQRYEIDPTVKAEVMRWLAFENMGGGLMSHYAVLPMGPYEDPLLRFLRGGEYPTLTRWKELGTGLFAGSPELVASFLDSLFDNESEQLKSAKDVTALVPDTTFYTDARPDSLAYYDQETLDKHYPEIAKEIASDRPKGLRTLNKLINAHLHVMWQNVFSDGIAVLKPHPEHSDELLANAMELARALSRCPDSPAPSTCPPNYPSCSGCAPDRVKISTPEQYSNSSTLFTIGTVPHPYTFATMRDMRESIDVEWIRSQARDPWLSIVTKDYLGTDIGGGARVKHLKEIIAGEPSSPAHSLWLTAEKEPPADMHWYFGFMLPHSEAAAAAEGDEDGTPAETAREREILDKAFRMVASEKKEDVKIREAIEAWNLADTEAWKFARAFMARRTMKRIEWEEEERKYIDGAGSEKGRHTWNRWMDKLEDKIGR
ncbi:hypothetical protein VUR80DRAFT_1215 [Thermomyces stellatus]